MIARPSGIAGKIELNSPKPNMAKAKSYSGRALTDARQKQAKSLELRAAMGRRGSGASRASGMRPAIFSLRSTAGLPKASTRSI
jgi:hypothetical protein